MKLNFSTVLGSALVSTGFVSMIAASPAVAAPPSQKEPKPPSEEVLRLTGLDCAGGLVSLGGVNATACEGAFEGNDSNSTFLADLESGKLFSNFVPSTLSWDLAAKSDDQGSWLTAPKTSDGSWGFSLPEALSKATFVLNLKAGNAFSSYLFKDFNFNGVTNWSGIFNTLGVSLDGSEDLGKNLSHASLYLASGGSTVPDPTPVPEPATLLGLAVVGGGLSLSRRRKSTSR